MLKMSSLSDTYAIRVNQLVKKYRIPNGQFKMDVMRRLIRQKSVGNTCPISGKYNSSQTLSDAKSLKNLIENVRDYDLTPDCFLDTLEEYFSMNNQPSALGYVNYLNKTYMIPLVRKNTDMEMDPFSIKF